MFELIVEEKCTGTTYLNHKDTSKTWSALYQSDLDLYITQCIKGIGDLDLMIEDVEEILKRDP